MVGAFAFGPVAFAAAGPVAAAFGPRAVLGFGAAWAAFGTLVVLAVPSVRRVTWLASGQASQGQCPVEQPRLPGEDDPLLPVQGQVLYQAERRPARWQRRPPQLVIGEPLKRAEHVLTLCVQ